MTTVTLFLAAIAAVITAATPGFLAWMQARKTHLMVNSRLTELIELTRVSAKAEGRLEESEHQRKKEAAAAAEK